MKVDKLRAKRLKWVLETVAHWKKELNLHGWKFKVLLEDNIREYNAAEINIQAEYERATITICSSFWDDKQNHPEYREQQLVHELCHCLTEECYDLLLAQHNDKLVARREIELARERVTERIAAIVCPVGDA